ncbi:MAG: topoisomerase DNA-binding C4 zinc finger domain-containing protein [Inquilinus sp.]|uniref:topoisomerase DNA-binding C4 zinc finger domain-containing protein n=1 Tax=Inquilinus sp. TaxID=1932117 RepID=UPI003F38E05A
MTVHRRLNPEPPTPQQQTQSSASSPPRIYSSLPPAELSLGGGSSIRTITIKPNNDAPVVSQAPNASQSPGTVLCPKCANPMVQRVARKGKRTGERFWGCSRFPRCTGMRGW